MAREICRVCKRKITRNRSAHLRREHGIATFKGAVAEYFLRPEDVGIPVREFEKLPEGANIADIIKGGE